MSANTDIIRRFCESFASGDLDVTCSFMTDECYWDDVVAEPILGRDAIRSAFGAFLGTLERFELLVQHIAETPDGAVLTERIDRISKNGEQTDLWVMGTFELEDGKIARWRDYSDCKVAAAFVE